MTLASALYGGGGGAKYKSGVFYPAVPLNNPAGAQTTLGNDYLVPFSPRATVTVGEVVYNRITGSVAGNVYVGIYSFEGTLLTDCAVDAVTTVGLHAVSTTPVTLIANEWYWLASNASAAVVNGDNITTADAEPRPTIYGRNSPGYYLDAGATGLSPTQIVLQKARANAALVSPLTITGFTQTSVTPYTGIIPA